MLKKKRVVEEDDGFKTRLDKTKKRFEETAGDGKYYKATPGKNYIRVLPPWGKGANGSFFFVGALHYGFKIGGRDRAIPCPAFSERGRCPVCEFLDKLKSSGDEDHKELAQKIRQSKKYWINIVRRTEKAENEDDKVKVEIYGANKKFINTLLEAFDEDDYGDVTDPVEGHDIILKRKGEGFQTRYTVTVRPRPTPLNVPDWKKQVHKLDEVVLEWMTEKEIEFAIAKNYGEEAMDAGYKLSGGKSKKKEEDDDDEEEDRPKKKRAKGPAKEDDEDDDEDEDDDDDGDE
jgi:hypothetical protein